MFKIHLAEADYIKGNHKIGGKTASQWAKSADREIKINY